MMSQVQIGSKCLGFIALLCAAGIWSACREKRSAAEAVQRHPFHGVIQSLDRTARTATIRHGAIPGFMGAMTMEYPVKNAAEFSKLRASETVDGTVFVQDSDFWIGELKESK